MTPSFDHDTALEPVGAGRWRATVSEHWFVVAGPNGGFLAALAALGCCATWRDGQPEWDDTQMPAAPPPDRCEPLPPRPPDAWLPAAHLRLPEPGFVPTLDLTVHWRAPLDPGAAEHPWVLVSFTTRLAAGGFWEEDGELWSPDGTLLAHSRQLAIVRPPRR